MAKGVQNKSRSMTGGGASRPVDGSGNNQKKKKKKKRKEKEKKKN